MHGVRSFLRRSTTAQLLSEAEIRELPHNQLLRYAISLSSRENESTDDSVGRSVESNGVVNVEDSVDQKHARKRRKKDRKRKFDMNRYGQRLIALRLSYLGWVHHGFASQPHSVNTVEHHLFHALTKTHLISSRDSCNYSRAGRTDVGVSARGQVIGLRVRSNVVPPSKGSTELRFASMLNSVLPNTIRVTAWAPVDDGNSASLVYDGDPAHIRAAANAVIASREQPNARDGVRRPGEPFSARFDALQRSYKYFFVRGNLDIDAMRRAGNAFVGDHNFRNFCKADPAVDNFNRVLYHVDVRPCDDAELGEHSIFYIFVVGQAFLWHQVRCMAAVLFEVGRCNERPDIVRRMLDDVRNGTGAFANGKPQYCMASPTPLVLDECAYPSSVVQFVSEADECKDDLRNVVQRTCFARADAETTKLYSEARLKAAVARTFLDSNDLCNVGVRVKSGGEWDMKDFGVVRPPRNFLLDVPFKSTYVPFEERTKEMHKGKRS